MKVFKNNDNKQEWNKRKDKDREETILEKINSLAIPWAKEEIEKEEHGEKRYAERVREKMKQDFTMKELTRAVGNCRDKSSPGLDGIEYKMIKDLSEKARKILLVLYNYSLATGYMYED